MTSQQTPVNQLSTTTTSSDNHKTLKRPRSDSDGHDEDMRRLAHKKARYQSYTPGNPARDCSHRAGTHGTPGLNAGVTQRHWAAHRLARYIARLPNGTNIVAPAWLRGGGGSSGDGSAVKVWRKDDRTGVLRPRRMMDDLLDKKKADRQERIARGVEMEEDEDEEKEDSEYESESESEDGDADARDEVDE